MDSDGPGVSGQLYRLGADLRRRARLELADEQWVTHAGLRPLTVAVLSHVAACGPSSQREISEAIGLDPSDLVAKLDQLEHAGFVERRRDPADRRRNVVVVTPEGKDAAGRLSEIGARAEAAVLERLTPAERKELARLIGRALSDDDVERTD